MLSIYIPQSIKGTVVPKLMTIPHWSRQTKNNGIRNPLMWNFFCTINVFSNGNGNPLQNPAISIG